MLENIKENQRFLTLDEQKELVDYTLKQSRKNIWKIMLPIILFIPLLLLIIIFGSLFVVGSIK